MGRNCSCNEPTQNNCNVKTTEIECVKNCCQDSYNAKYLCKQQKNICKDSCYAKYENAKEDAYTIYNKCCEKALTCCDKDKCQQTLETTLCRLKKERNDCLFTCDKKFNVCCNKVKKMEQDCKQECTPYYLWQMYCCCGPDVCAPTDPTAPLNNIDGPM